LPRQVVSLSLPLQRIEEFLESVVPFNLLPKTTIKEVAKTILIEYYPKGISILEDTTEIPFLYLIYSGIVKITGEKVEYRSEGDYIGGIGFIKEKAYTIKAIEDVVCYLIPKKIFLKLCKDYKAFYEHFNNRLRPLAEQLKKQKPPLPHLAIRLNELVKMHPVTCTEGTSIITVAQSMARSKVGSIIVVNKNGSPSGIVTKTDLAEKVVAKNLDLKAPVGKIMTAPVINIDKDASYFEALLKMAKHDCGHLCVLDKKQFIGVISLRNLILLQGMNFITFIAEIQRQDTSGELASLVARVDQVIHVLLNEGASPMLIMELTSEFTDRTLRRLLSFLNKSSSYSLMGLGELGRQEQNWLLPLKLGLICNNREKREFLAKRFSETFKKCGFHLYEDGIFCSSIDQWKDTLRNWLSKRAVDRLCFFLDAREITGEKAIFNQVKNTLYLEKRVLKLLCEQILKIDIPQGFVRGQVLFDSERLEQRLNLGEVVEVIVSGTRFLSFFHQIEKTNTFKRLDILEERGILEKEIVVELKEIYDFLNTFRIKLGSDWLNSTILSNQEKILLEACFWSLKEFKKICAFYRFALN